MARKKGTSENPQEAAPQVDYCRDCAKPSGYCVKAHDGRPIFCRCPHRPGRLVLLSEPGCRAFIRRTEPLPSEFPFGLVND